MSRGRDLDRSAGADVLGCPVAVECGGCAWIERPYAEQLRLKTGRVRDALLGVGLSSLAVDDCLPSPSRAGYRNRAKLAVAEVAGDVRIGLYRRGGNEIVDLAPCRVQSPVLLDALERLRAWLRAHRLARPEGPLFYVDLRATAAAGCHVTLVVDARRAGSVALPLDDLVTGWQAIEGVAINYGDAGSSYPLGSRTEIVRGARRFLAPLPSSSAAEWTFEVPPTGFFQVGPAALQAVHRLMVDHLGDEGPLYDLYCGVGVHGLVVAHATGGRGGNPFVGVDESVPLIEAARRNAERHGIAAEFVAGRVETVLAAPAGRPRARRVILNPGRSGCRPAVLAALAGGSAGRLAYLSCNPLTLARDLASFVDAGIVPMRIAPVDLMPQTDHVEALALLVRAPGQKG